MNSKVLPKTEEAQKNCSPGGNHNPFKKSSIYKIKHKNTINMCF